MAGGNFFNSFGGVAPFALWTRKSRVEGTQKEEGGVRTGGSREKGKREKRERKGRRRRRRVWWRRKE